MYTNYITNIGKYIKIQGCFFVLACRLNIYNFVISTAF